MPKYEYVCGNCGAELEIEQRISDDALTTCPKCNSESLERLISRSNFSLKGGGWYADGYGDSSKSASSGGSIGGESSSSSKDDSSTSESKSNDSNSKETNSSATDSTDSSTS